jgi:hypothetical protein
MSGPRLVSDTQGPGASEPGAALCKTATAPAVDSADAKMNHVLDVQVSSCRPPAARDCARGDETHPCVIGVFETIFRELEWKTPIFSWRAVPKFPKAL